MARTRRLDDLRDDLRKAANIVGKTNRHPDANLTRLINEACQLFRNRVSKNGHEYYLETQTDTTSAGSSTTTLPTDMVALFGVDLTRNGRTISLLPYDQAERNDFDYVWPGSGNTEDTPRFYRAVKDDLELVPTPDAAYSIAYKYLPTHTDLSADGDTFDGIAGWEKWVVYTAALDILLRDKRPMEYQLCKDRLAAVEADMEWMTPRRARGAPVRRRNRWKERRNLTSLARWRLP